MKKATVTPSGERELRIERIFDAARDRVWRAMTDPAQLAQWWGRGNKLVIERFELRKGGHWRFIEHSPQGKHGFEGRIRELEAPSRIVQTFDWDGAPGHVIVNASTLEELGDGRTKLTVVTTFFTAADRDAMLETGMEGGMNQSYAALDAVLAHPAPAPSGAGAIARVAFTMYPIKDAARARAFYEETLGLTVATAGGHEGKVWIEYDLPGGGCLALTNTNGNDPSAAAGGTIALEVDDLPAIIARLKAKDVVFKSGVIAGPHCRMAVCLDSEGNSILLHQLDASA